MVLADQDWEAARRCRMGLKHFIRYEESSKAQMFKELKVQGWVWGLFFTRKQGKYSCQPAEESHWNTPMGWALTSTELMCLYHLSSFAIRGEHLLIDPLFRGGLERLKEIQMHIWNNNLSPGYTNPFWWIRKQVQGWLRLLNTPQCFYQSKAHPVPIPQAASRTKFPSKQVASVILSTQLILLVVLFIHSEHFKVRVSLLLQSDIPSNHF